MLIMSTLLLFLLVFAFDLSPDCEEPRNFVMSWLVQPGTPRGEAERFFVNPVGWLVVPEDKRGKEAATIYGGGLVVHYRLLPQSIVQVIRKLDRPCFPL